MKSVAWIGILGLAASLAAEANPRDAKADIKAAAKKIQDASGYSWTSTPKSEGGGGGGGQGGRFQPGPTEGKLEKDGFVWIKTTQGDNSTEAVLKGGKVAVKTADGWKAGSEFQGGQGGGQQGRRDPAAGLARRLQNFKAPAIDAEGLVDKVGDVKDEGEGAFSGALTEDGAKSLMTFGGRGGGGNAPQITDPKGTVKFWVKDGALVKYEYNVQGKMTVRDREININRTVTVEFKDVGSTKVEVSEDAKKKLE
jgi:hypothetical protein